MAVAGMVDARGSQEIYERARDLVGVEGHAGGIRHLADALAFLRERLLPAVEAVGAPGTLPRPQFWPVPDYVA